MQGEQPGRLQVAIGAIASVAVAVLLVALQEAEVISTTAAAYLGIVAVCVLFAGLVAWLVLDARRRADRRRPKIPGELFFREDDEILHRPKPDPHAPWQHVLRLASREVISPVTLKVWTNRPVQWVGANIYRDAEFEGAFDRILANLGSGHKSKSLTEFMTKATQLDKGVRWALVTFDDDLRLTAEDNLDVIAHGAMEGIRITRVELVKPPR